MAKLTGPLLIVTKPQDAAREGATSLPRRERVFTDDAGHHVICLRLFEFLNLKFKSGIVIPAHNYPMKTNLLFLPPAPIGFRFPVRSAFSQNLNIEFQSSIASQKRNTKSSPPAGRLRSPGLRAMIVMQHNAQ